MLQEKATEIKEVKLKTKLITKRGDTISYDLKSFESKADRSLADVLKKIPGIEVNKDGSILYQGEPINKFYVNGKDLMEGSYGLINNSLPKDAVQKVEVLENHQPVKILQDKLSSENAAINVQLKIYYHDRKRRNFSWCGAISLECKTYTDAFYSKIPMGFELQNQ